MKIKRYPLNERMSRAVIYNNTLYLCGQVSDDEINNMKDQTKSTLANLDAALAEQGLDKSDLLSVLIHITDMELFDEMNEVWDAWVDKDNAPVRTCVEANLAEDYLVELTVVAAMNK